MAIKLYSLLLLTVLGYTLGYAQYPGNPLPQYPEAWTTQWITHPDIDQTAHNLIHFRNTFALEEVPDQFVVHVSGDNRYRLYVNGQEAGYGPQLGDIRHWRYETLDLAPYLQKGQNIVAVEVMNWGVERSYGIISFRTGFLMQAHTPVATVLNTGYDSRWKVHRNEGVFGKTVHWRGGGEKVAATYPTAQGPITVDYRLEKPGQPTGQAVLPATTHGTFVWKEGTTILKPGVNTLDFQN